MKNVRKKIYLNCKVENCDYKTCHESNLRDHIICWHTEEGILRKKKSEDFTFTYLQKHIQIKRQHYIDLKCIKNGTCAYIDGLSIDNGIIFCHENDEHQHKAEEISCETRRMIDIKNVFLQEGNDMPLVFIRFNPDGYRKNKILQNKTKEERLKRYIEIYNQIKADKENLKPVNIFYLFYDVKNDKLEILDDPEYPGDIKELVKFEY
jgi:hypothetical protein